MLWEKTDYMHVYIYTRKGKKAEVDCLIKMANSIEPGQTALGQT